MYFKEIESDKEAKKAYNENLKANAAKRLEALTKRKKKVKNDENV